MNTYKEMLLFSVTFPFSFRKTLTLKYILFFKIQGENNMDKRKENGILLVQREVVECCIEVDDMKKETELYNSIYKELSELVGLDATLKIYLRFKGQQVSFPVRLYNPQMIQQSVIKEYDGTNIAELARKYDYSEKSIRRMIKSLIQICCI
jgi:Mor family transcriptional regulator